MTVTIQHGIEIAALPKIVWKHVIGLESYKRWTAPFCEGSYFTRQWVQGQTMRFVVDDQDGKASGMIGRIAEFRPYEFISIEHFGIVEAGIDKTTGEDVEKWAPSFENYTLTATQTGTHFEIEMETLEECLDFFQEGWPKALNVLKELAEMDTLKR